MCSNSFFMITISSSDTFTCQEFESLNYDFDDVVVNVLMLSLLKINCTRRWALPFWSVVPTCNLPIFKDMDEAAAVSLTYSIYSILCKPYHQFPSSKFPDNHSLMGRPHIRKHWFQNRVQWAEVLDMCLILRSSISRLVSLLWFW